MKRVLDFLKKILFVGSQAATDVAKMYNPLLGQLLSIILNKIVVAEASVPISGSGSIKKDLVAIALTSKGEDIVALFNSGGKPIINPELFAEGVVKIQEGIVDILNSTGVNTKPPVPEV